MKPPSVMIIGAGAMGMVAGYHLALGGTGVSFLVRPGRCAAFAAPQDLYCYDDHQVKRFDH
ncbi:MAG: 2-dehydropantoate 2-reductase N-terminal domain-containing protein [Panacagrimonas sp.]